MRRMNREIWEVSLVFPYFYPSLLFPSFHPLCPPHSTILPLPLLWIFITTPFCFLPCPFPFYSSSLLSPFPLFLFSLVQFSHWSSFLFVLNSFQPSLHFFFIILYFLFNFIQPTFIFLSSVMSFHLHLSLWWPLLLNSATLIYLFISQKKNLFFCNNTANCGNILCNKHQNWLFLSRFKLLFYTCMNSIEIKVYEELKSVHSLWKTARQIMESTSGQKWIWDTKQLWQKSRSSEIKATKTHFLFPHSQPLCTITDLSVGRFSHFFGPSFHLSSLLPSLFPSLSLPPLPSVSFGLPRRSGSPLFCFSDFCNSVHSPLPE